MPDHLNTPCVHFSTLVGDTDPLIALSLPVFSQRAVDFHFYGCTLLLGEVAMNPPKGSRHTLLAALVSLVCGTVLLSCRPAALQLTVSSSIVLPPTLTEVAIRQMLATKVADLANMDQTETAARLTPHPKILKPTPMPQTSIPEPTAFPPVSALHGENVTPVGTGVIGQFMPLLNKGRYHVLNAWVANQHSDRQRVFVWAGELAGAGGEDTTQGVVIVEVFQILIKDGLAINTFVEATSISLPAKRGLSKSWMLR
jgi:hypothetical protein